MSKKNNLTGGILVCVIHDGVIKYHYGENSYWLLDDWEYEIVNGGYLKEIDSLRVTKGGWPEVYRKKYLPKVIVDLDNKVLRNNYYDQAIERRVPSGWEGYWIENQEEFLEYIPSGARFWETEG